MKIAVIGDMHLGAFQVDERSDDSFIQAKEAIEIAVKEDADLIVLAGDVFDVRVPTQDVLAKALQIFRIAAESKNKGAKIEKLIGKDEGEISKTALGGIPIVAIHGNHDRRGKGLVNPVQLMEKAGLLVHLNIATIVIAINGERVAIHGMSYVPEKYAKEVLAKFNPNPIKGAANIFIFHQSIGQYLYSNEEHPTLMLEDLPRGFDLIADGHIHWSDTHKGDGLNFLLTGSTISTQMRKIEGERPKAIHIFENGNIRAIPLKSQRELFYETLDFKEIEPDLLRKKISETLHSIKVKGDKKPLVRVVLRGTIKKGFEAADLNLHRIEEEFRGKFILHIGREKLLSKENTAAKEALEQLLKKQISVEERGLQILQAHLSGSGFESFGNAEEFLNVLAEGGQDAAYKFLKEKIGGTGAQDVRGSVKL